MNSPGPREELIKALKAVYPQIPKKPRAEKSPDRGYGPAQLYNARIPESKEARELARRMQVGFFAAIVGAVIGYETSQYFKDKTPVKKFDSAQELERQSETMEGPQRKNFSR